MANRDRIAEVYKGEIWEPAQQRRARERVHWMCRQAEGRVLDLGCSQGIASVLLAREGLEVVGVDIEHDRLTYANADRAAEPEAVAARLVFIEAEGARLPFPDDCFDTVLVGEVIEHLVKPEPVLAEVARVLKPAGVVALTTPFGLSPHHDHKQTFYPASMIEVVASHLQPLSLHAHDRYLRMVASKDHPDAVDPAQLVVDAQPHLEAAFVEAERDLLNAERGLRETEQTYKTTDQARRRAEQARAAAEKLARETEAARVQAEAQLADARADLTEAQGAQHDLERRLRHAERSLTDLRAQHQTLTKERSRLQYDLEMANWKLQATLSRRWWRLGMLLNEARRRRRKLLALPLELARLALGPSTRPDPPQRHGSRGGADRTRAPARQHVAVTERPQLLAPPPARRLGDLRVASVLDTMSAACFGPECRLTSFRPDNWQAVLEQERPHLLLVESAWQGNGGSWQYQVGSYAYEESVGLPHLSRLVDWCRQHDVPAVFWNKEDPVHFDKFKEAARLFDVVLTTDADCVDRYRALSGLRAEHVAALPFAAQPRLHNPVGVGERRPEPVFAGSYYRNRHPERRAQLEWLLDAAVPYGLRIYDRNHGQVSDTFGFPERFADHIVGGLPYDEMVRTYKRHKVFLNANSVTASPTMFSRRVFELLACGTAVVSTPSAGITRMFDGVVQVAESPEQARAALERLLHDDTAWAATSAEGVRRVMLQHTYAHRLAEIAALAGYDVPAFPEDRITVLALRDDPSAVQTLRATIDVEGGVVAGAVVGTLEDTSGSDELVVIPQEPGTSRDARWRELASRASTGWVLLLGENERPSRETLTDLLACTRFADADVIGDAVGQGHSYGPPVQPHAVLARRELIAQRGWDDGPGAAERQQDWAREGVRVYAATPGGAAVRAGT